MSEDFWKGIIAAVLFIGAVTIMLLVLSHEGKQSEDIASLRRGMDSLFDNDRNLRSRLEDLEHPSKP